MNNKDKSYKAPDTHHECRMQLPDANVDESETDPQPQLQLALQLELEEAVRIEPRFVTFELPNTAWQQRQQLDEARALVEDMIDHMLPVSSEADRDARDESDSSVCESTSTTTTTIVNRSGMSNSLVQTLRTNDERLHRLLHLLDRYTRNLEEQMLSANRVDSACACAELQLTQPGSVRFDVTSTIRPKSNQLLHQLQQQPQPQSQSQPQPEPQSQSQSQPQQMQSEMDAPCERRYHTITISANSTSSYGPGARRPTTTMGRIGQALNNFVGACCLCLQVNKDCVFCLGFFIAFVISASFLTAFFYRTINLTQSSMRVSIEASEQTGTSGEMVTLRDGRYYYIYSNPRQHFV